MENIFAKSFKAKLQEKAAQAAQAKREAIERFKASAGYQRLIAKSEKK